MDVQSFIGDTGKAEVRLSTLPKVPLARKHV